MKTGFKKWCWSKEYIMNKLGIVLYKGEIIDIDNISIPLEILIKAMWTINREKNYKIDMDDQKISIWDVLYPVINYFYEDYNNSEQKALEKALMYIFEQEVT